MQRRREAVLHHVLRREIGERRMQALELVEIVEHRLHHLVHGIGRHLRRRHERGEHAIGFGVLRIVGIQAGRDRRLRIVGLALEQLVDLGALERYQLSAAGRRGILDVGARMADGVEETVDLAVAQRRTVLVGLQLGCEREFVGRPAERAQQFIHRRTCPRPRVADVEALALEVGELLHIGLLAGDDGEGFRMHRKHRAQVSIGAGILELAHPLERVELDIRLDEAEVELALLDGIDVEDRAAGGLDGAADVVRCTVLVDQSAHRAARGVVDTGDATGTDGDELLLGGNRAAAQGGHRCERDGCCQRNGAQAARGAGR